jgi:hypothetical protein
MDNGLSDCLGISEAIPYKLITHRENIWEIA